MKSSRLTRLALVLFAGLWLAPFARAQSGGQDGPLATERFDDDTKGPDKGDAWAPADRTGGPPPPDDRRDDDDGTVDPPDGTSGDDGEEKGGTLSSTTSLRMDGSWEVHADGSATLRLTFFGPDTLARLGLVHEGRFFELALVPASTDGSRMTLFLTPAQARAIARVAFVLQPVEESQHAAPRLRAHATRATESPAPRAPRPVASNRARRG